MQQQQDLMAQQQMQQDGMDKQYAEGDPNMQGMDMQMYQMQQQSAAMSMMPASDWIPLDDQYNMVDESTIPPDFYIDRPPDAVYIEEEEGRDQAIQVRNVDPDLFDYNVEVEPILQVLVGKALEQARIEVIEEHEDGVLGKRKAVFKQKREAMLIQTQRMEARQ